MDVLFQAMRSGVKVPEKQHESDAGYDLRWYPTDDEAQARGKILLPGTIYFLETGVGVQMEPGHAALVLPRSGLSTEGLAIVNSPGLIDSGYRGEIKVLASMFLGRLHLKPGDRIAQLIFVRLADAEAIEVDELEESDRGAQGLGSTGVE